MGTDNRLYLKHKLTGEEFELARFYEGEDWLVFDKWDEFEKFLNSSIIVKSEEGLNLIINNPLCIEYDFTYPEIKKYN